MLSNPYRFMAARVRFVCAQAARSPRCSDDVQPLPSLVTGLASSFGSTNVMVSGAKKNVNDSQAAVLHRSHVPRPVSVRRVPV